MVYNCLKLFLIVITILNLVHRFPSNHAHTRLSVSHPVWPLTYWFSAMVKWHLPTELILMQFNTIHEVISSFREHTVVAVIQVPSCHSDLTSVSDITGHHKHRQSLESLKFPWITRHASKPRHWRTQQRCRCGCTIIYDKYISDLATQTTTTTSSLYIWQTAPKHPKKLEAE